MKIKTIIFLLFTLFTSNFLCQTKNYEGEIIYEAESIIGNLENLKVKGFSKNQEIEFKALLKNQTKIKYKLLFNRNASIFKQIKKLNKNDNKFNLTQIIGGKGVFYVNKLTKLTINQKEFSDEIFLVDIPQLNWKLTQDSKKIGKYICYKATTTKEINTSRGKSLRKIIAWYTLQIPFNYGPKEYNGLPGLILELQQDKLLFRASKINLFSEKKLEINKPTKGKKVTLKEYDSIVKEVYYSRRRKKY
ncbi:GLPGLI family protein [Polaribacter ponticola]|uniref:GLPGLI family protein n=1 Tax=Polaribacter ponticola TaxID=2978475 RepID=A0ABT5SBZ6_9FLAO|nr:GLPGLI family protein [Polaribacter sp. MSW5]MDD7915637.1 GLPGLI family protein [Polaribacter sp. MSW5]